MQGVTNQLIELTKSFNLPAFSREYDAVISSGEQVAAGLLAMCLNSTDLKAKSLNAWQIPIKITGEFSNATIDFVNKQTILNELDNGTIPVITGFQGISDKMDIYTIGRGGSDATACAIASAINADECLIYTDVDGVYSADPRIVLPARHISDIAYEDMLALANGGAAVLQAKSILIAKEYNVNLRVLSSFSTSGETKITDKTVYVSTKYKIAGIAHNLTLSTLVLTDNPSTILQITNHLQHIDLIKMEQSNLFLFPKSYQSEVERILNEIGILFEIDGDSGVITIVGNLYSKTQVLFSEITAEMEKHHHQIKYIFSQNNSISIVLPFQQTCSALNILHKYFFE
jgi:aspartate kinase